MKKIITIFSLIIVIIFAGCSNVEEDMSLKQATLGLMDDNITSSDISSTALKYNLSS